MKRFLLATAILALTASSGTAQQVDDNFKIVMNLKDRAFYLQMSDGLELPIVGHEKNGIQQTFIVYYDVDDGYCGQSFKIHNFTIQFTCNLD